MESKAYIVKGKSLSYNKNELTRGHIAGQVICFPTRFERLILDPSFSDGVQLFRYFMVFKPGTRVSMVLSYVLPENTEMFHHE